MKLMGFSKLAEKAPNEVSAKIGRSTLVARKHSPTMLFAAGVVGVVATVVMASKATLKAGPILEESKKKIEQAKAAKALDDEKYTQTDYQRDLTVAYTTMSIDAIKLYGPAVVVGIASVAALTGSHVILNNRIGALGAAYAALDKGFTEYRKRVLDEFGEEKDQEFRRGIRTREITEVDEDGKKKKRKVKEVVPDAVSGYACWFDDTNKNWDVTPELNFLFLRSQQTFVNQLLQANGYVFLNEVYERLGLKKTTAGQIVGWVRDSEKGDGYIDFGIFNRSADVDAVYDLVTGDEKGILLDFNVDGPVYDLIGNKKGSE